MLRSQVQELVSHPGLILSDDLSAETIDWAGELLHSLERPATDDEAAALVELLSRSDDSCYGLNWSILHFIETAPGWPIWSALNEVDGVWAETLRVGLRNANQYPPE